MTSYSSHENFFNLARYCLHNNAQEFPDKTALIFADHSGRQQSYTYKEIEEKALCFSSWLQQKNLPRSSRLFLKLKTGPNFVICFFGALAAGLVPIPLSPLLTDSEVIKFATLVSPEILIMERNECDSHITSLLPDSDILTSDALSCVLEEQMPAPYVKTQPEDPAFMVFTSGTSALPKVVVHGHRVVLGRRPMFDGWTDINPKDRVLHAGALNWTYSLGVGLLDVFCASATSIFFTDATSPEDWPKIIHDTKASIFAAVPSLYRRILKYGNMQLIAASNLRHGLCAGEPLPAKLCNSWREITSKHLYEALGMSEISTYISSSPHMVIKPGSPGVPQSGRKISILKEPVSSPVDKVLCGETGIIAVHESDPGLLLGYYINGEVVPPALIDGWFLTGDRASCDEDGYIWFDGRSDEMMNPSGFRVSPLEVEEVLSHADSCAEIAVCEVGIKEDVRLIMAFVVLTSGHLEKEALKELDELSSRLASYKRPHRFVFIDSLPRTSNGKIKRSELVEIGLAS